MRFQGERRTKEESEEWTAKKDPDHEVETAAGRY